MNIESRINGIVFNPSLPCSGPATTVHVTQMLVYDVGRRQLRNESRHEQNAHDHDTQIIHLSNAQKKIRNRVNGRKDIKGKKCW